MGPHLTSKQLVAAAIEGRPAPRPPVGPLAVHFCARVAGRSVRDYTTRAQTLAECVIRYYERFRPDAVWVSADTWVTAEAMGAQVDFPGPHEPLGGVGPPRVQVAADVDRIPPPDPSRQGRWPLMCEALRLVSEALGQEAFVVACFDQYPFSLAAALMGLENVMLKLTDDRPLVEALMQRGAEYAIAYGRALAQAGCDLLSGGDSPAGLVNPVTYREVALPFEQRVIAELKATTGRTVSLHICGRATPLLASMATSGADVLELDHAVDLAEACQIVGPGVTLWGNLDPVTELAQGTPTTVVAAARRALASVRSAGHRRFVLSSGCTLALETPFANVEALCRIVL